MALEGPQLHYVRAEDVDDDLARALRLAHEIEELLSRRSSTARASAPDAQQATRIARAMSASLIDELEALVRGARKSGIATG